MKKEFIIEGMTCQNCVAKVQKKISSLNEDAVVNVQLQHPQLVLDSKDELPISDLANALSDYGYTISKIFSSPIVSDNIAEKNITTYKPLIIIISFILGTTLLAQFPFDQFDTMKWMRHFMAGFFLTFSFFKLLNLRGFAESYQMYDIISKRWFSWGLIYPFIELGLGIMYLINIYPLVNNILTIGILGISSIGVIQSVLNKTKIKCACLGDVFNLPMSTVTIIEDLTMVGMALLML